MGRKAVCLQADLLDEDAIAPLVPDAAMALGGPISVLVNNASIFEQDSIATATRQSWDRHMMSNLRAPFVLIQAFAAQVPPPVADMAGEPLAQGLVVNLIDQKVRKLTPQHMTYSIAKMGLWAFTRLAAQELGGHVRVNAVGPGPTLQAHDQTRAVYEASRRATLLGRGANLDDITAALGFFSLMPRPSQGNFYALTAGSTLHGKRLTSRHPDGFTAKYRKSCAPLTKPSQSCNQICRHIKDL